MTVGVDHELDGRHLLLRLVLDLILHDILGLVVPGRQLLMLYQWFGPTCDR